MHATPLSIRPAVAADALAVARVHVRSWQEGFRGLMAQPYLDSLRAEDRAGHYTLGSADPRVPSTFVAEVDDVVQGFASVGASEAGEEHVGQLLALYVDPSAWGTGIGRSLIARARAELHSRGDREAVLWMLVGSVRAQLFYALDGWQPDGAARTVKLWGIDITETRLRRALP